MKTKDEIKALPIGQIVDGWDLRDDGGLYLFVRIPDENVIQTIILPKTGGLGR